MNKLPAILFACGVTALIIILGLDIKTKPSAQTSRCYVTVYSPQGYPADRAQIELLTATKRQISTKTTNSQGQAWFDAATIQNSNWKYLKISAPSTPLQAPLIVHRSQVQWPLEAHLPAL